MEYIEMSMNLTTSCYAFLSTAEIKGRMIIDTLFFEYMYNNLAPYWSMIIWQPIRCEIVVLSTCTKKREYQSSHGLKIVPYTCKILYAINVLSIEAAADLCGVVPSTIIFIIKYKFYFLLYLVLQTRLCWSSSGIMRCLMAWSLNQL